MEFKLEINGSESEGAGFVGWTPVKCTLEVKGFDGKSEMPVLIRTGNYGGSKGKINLYLQNSTTSTSVDQINHDFRDKRKLTFYIAGVFGHASVGKKDTFIKIESESSDNSVETLERDIMVRVRKNANDLTDEEVEKFLTGFLLLSKLPPREFYGDATDKTNPKKLLDEIVLMHTLDTSQEIHGRTSFHPWHRAFLLHLEREIQEIFPEVTIPYWKFDEGANKVFQASYIGKTRKTAFIDDPDTTIDDNRLFYGEREKPKFDHLNPLYSYVQHVFWGGPLRRAYRENDPSKEKPIGGMLRECEIIYGQNPEEGQFRVEPKSFWNWSRLEERGSHNAAHFAFTGHVVNIGQDPVDPLFFMMHGNVDRLWALWQRVYDRFNGNEITTYPFQGKYEGTRGETWGSDGENIINEDGIYNVGNSDVGNFAEDTLWPWDLDQELSRPTRNWRSNQEGFVYADGNVAQINVEFPSSITSGYPNEKLTVKSTIDYQARYSNVEIQGFDYDYISYFDADKIHVQKDCLESKLIPKSTFFNLAADVSTRLDAANGLLIESSTDDKKIQERIFDHNEETSIRVKSIQLANESKVPFLDSLLEIIEDKDGCYDEELRWEAINKFFVAKRTNKAWASRQAQFFNLLRGLIKDEKNNNLRMEAIGILSAHEDRIVQDFILMEVQKEDSKLVSKNDALYFLSQNVKSQHAKKFKEIFKDIEDSELQKTAIEALGNDQGSYEFIKKVFLNKLIDFIVREAAGLSLHNLNYSETNKLALQIILDVDGNNGKIRLFSQDEPKTAEVDFKAGLLNMIVFTADSKLLGRYQTKLNPLLKELVNVDDDTKSKLLTTLEKSGDTERGDIIVVELARKLLDKIS